MLSLFLYYVFYSSVVLIYGAGLGRSLYLCENPNHLFLKACKMLFCVVLTSILSFLFTSFILVPSDLAELYPFVAILIFIALSVFIESIIRLTVKISVTEFSVALLFVFISLTESTTLSECLLISLFSLFSFFFFIPVLFSIYNRITLSSFSYRKNIIDFVVVSLIVVLFVFLSWNVSWLNKGVFQW